MSSTAVARRYAEALVELGEESKCLDAVVADLKEFAQTLESSPELAAALSNPGFSRDEQNAVIRAVLGSAKYQTIARNFILLIVGNGRMGVYSEILSAIQARYDAIRGRVRAEITSATPLDQATLDTLAEHVRKLTGKSDVVLDAQVDPDLIGGIVTRVGDTVLDGSIRTQLSKLRGRLLGQQVAGEA